MNDFCQKYLNLLQNEYSGLNLTRITDPNEFFLKQYEDSVRPILRSKEFQKSLKEQDLIIDVGFGGGFPLLPLAAEYPTHQFYGIEARDKKVKAVNDIAQRLNLLNVQCFHQRLEEIDFDRPTTLTLKAVGKIKDYLKLIHASAPVKVFFYKGTNVYTEENPPTEFNSWHLLETISFDLTPEIRRYLFCYQIVPHGTNSSKKHLVRASVRF